MFFGGSKIFLEKVFSKFGYQDIKSFFKELGILFYTECKNNQGKVFPITDKAENIHKVLLEELRLLDIEVVTDAKVENVEKRGNLFKVSYVTNSGGRHIFSKLLLLSLGGKSYSQLGTKGEGYKFAKHFGHQIVTPVPSGVPLKSKNPLSFKIDGLTLDVEISLENEQKKEETFKGELMFTKYGLSGPAALSISRIVSVLINRHKKRCVEIKVDFCPGIDVAQHLKNIWDTRNNIKVIKSLYGLVSAEFAKAFLEAIWIDPKIEASQLNKDEKKRILKKLKVFTLEINGTLGWERAKFTAGGVATKGVDPDTLKSKFIDNLYFSGEILDVDGAVGGYNLSWAWSSGAVAGGVKT